MEVEKVLSGEMMADTVSKIGNRPSICLSYNLNIYAYAWYLFS